MHTHLGREFRILFLSTVESVDPESGQSANPTKSLCNPYVFNTAITRAQSLVVASGNPFTLLAVEAKMPQPKYCWKEFLRRCNDNGTLKMDCDPTVKKEFISALTGKKGNCFISVNVDIMLWIHAYLNVCSLWQLKPETVAAMVQKAIQ